MNKLSNLKGQLFVGDKKIADIKSYELDCVINKPKILNLVLAYKWFDMIKAGLKKIEYREYKPYWNKKFLNNKYDIVRFQRGYSKDPEVMFFKIKDIGFSKLENDLNLPHVWAIVLGEKIERPF